MEEPACKEQGLRRSRPRADAVGDECEGRVANALGAMRSSPPTASARRRERRRGREKGTTAKEGVCGSAGMEGSGPLGDGGGGSAREGGGRRGMGKEWVGGADP